MSKAKIQILVVDDEIAIRKLLRYGLDQQEYELFEADTGEAGLRLAASQNPDLILLDLGLPGLDGIEFTRRLREWSACPIIILSVREREQDKVAALDAGADDYLTKPFGIAELQARIRVALRHATPETSGQAVFRAGDLEIDLSSRMVRRAGAEVHLTPIEFKLVAMLARNAGKVVTHRHMLTEIWGSAYAEETHYLRVYMGQLRHKLEVDPAQPEVLITESGVGYRLRCES